MEIKTLAAKTAFLAILCIFISCQTKNHMVEHLDIEGHRGCRGLLPENTIPAFTKALDLGVTTLEMDLVVTRDSQVIVSHEPFFNHLISTHPDGIPVTEENEKDFNIFQMDFAEVKNWDVGSKTHPNFPNQEKMKVAKPLFREVIRMAEQKAREINRPLPQYNVEIKSRPSWDSKYHPPIPTYTDLVMDVVNEFNVGERTIIQSFDVRSLQYLKKNYPEMKTALLISNTYSIEKNLELLGFTPTIYSPDYRLVNEAMVHFCKQKEVQLIPWTVNDANTMGELIRLGVDGIITDYPDVLVDLMEKLETDAGN